MSCISTFQSRRQIAIRRSGIVWDWRSVCCPVLRILAFALMPSQFVHPSQVKDLYPLLDLCLEERADFARSMSRYSIVAQEAHKQLDNDLNSFFTVLFPGLAKPVRLILWSELTELQKVTAEATIRRNMRVSDLYTFFRPSLFYMGFLKPTEKCRIDLRYAQSGFFFETKAMFERLVQLPGGGGA